MKTRENVCGEGCRQVCSGRCVVAVTGCCLLKMSGMWVTASLSANLNRGQDDVEVKRGMLLCARNEGRLFPSLHP